MAESNAVLELKAKNDKLKAELKAIKYQREGCLNEALQRKNLQLEALHFVWCSGGCDGGHGPELTGEIVVRDGRNTRRLRTWWINKQLRENYICRTCGGQGHLMCSRGTQQVTEEQA